MDFGLSGRTVIVTGGTGGIGRKLVRHFAAEGAQVVLTYHRAQHDAELLVKEIGENARAVNYDMSEPGAGKTLVDQALDWTGRIDVLVNNAGYWGSMALSDESRFEAVDGWQSLFRFNAEGAIRLSLATAPVMRQQKWGRMVHISSTLAVGGAAGAEYYAAAKAALHGFSRSAAFSLGKDGDILSNVVMLGLTGRPPMPPSPMRRRATTTPHWHLSDGCWTPMKSRARSSSWPRLRTPESPGKCFLSAVVRDGQVHCADS